MNERKEEAREGGGGGMELRQYIALLLIDSVKSWRELSLMNVCVHHRFSERIVLQGSVTVLKDGTVF